jgi:predicted HTH domain antitoxin
METCIKLPNDIASEIKLIKKTGLYRDEGEFIKDAVNTLLSARKDVRESLAVELYKEGKISLGRFAELMNLSYEESKELLASKKIKIRRGSKTPEEMTKGAKRLLELIR